jgi:hypothetical protein
MVGIPGAHGSAVLATGVLLVAACGPAAGPGAAIPSGVPSSRVLRGPAPAPHFTDLAFPDAADGWLLGEPAADVAGAGSASAEIWPPARRRSASCSGTGRPAGSGGRRGR